MTPEEEREAQYADELVAALPQDARDKLLTDWAQYLVDREQTDQPGRHRDFVLGWIACYDSHELRPRLVHVTFKDPEPQREPQPPTERALTLYEKMMKAQAESNEKLTLTVKRYSESARTVTVNILKEDREPPYRVRMSGWPPDKTPPTSD